MSVSGKKSAYAFPAEVARFLEVEPADIERMERLDDLPVTRVPKRTRTVKRIYLPDFHAWLLKRSTGERKVMTDYKAWLGVFWEAAVVEGKCRVSSDQ